MSTDTKLYKVPFPGSESVRRFNIYENIKDWFDNNGYIYNLYYRFEWVDTGKYVPDYIWVDSELAVLIKLRFGYDRNNR
jgi:hypothetical protein